MIEDKKEDNDRDKRGMEGGRHRTSKLKKKQEKRRKEVRVEEGAVTNKKRNTNIRRKCQQL